jgi:hypothetical protein
MKTLPESDIRIDADGVWFYRGVEMTRRDIISLFYEHLQRDSAGRYFIEMNGQRRLMVVEDAAYVVWSLRWSEESAFLLLSDDSVEIFEPDTLRIAANHVPYCLVKNRRFEARFSRAAYYRLAERLHFDSLTGKYSVGNS